MYSKLRIPLPHFFIQLFRYKWLHRYVEIKFQDEVFRGNGFVTQWKETIFLMKQSRVRIQGIHTAKNLI